MEAEERRLEEPGEREWNRGRQKNQESYPHWINRRPVRIDQQFKNSTTEASEGSTEVSNNTLLMDINLQQSVQVPFLEFTVE